MPTFYRLEINSAAQTFTVKETATQEQSLVETATKVKTILENTMHRCTELSRGFPLMMGDFSAYSTYYVILTVWNRSLRNANYIHPRVELSAQEHQHCLEVNQQLESIQQNKESSLHEIYTVSKS